MIKAAFFDIDGTLLSHKTNSVPESARYAIRALRETGILTFIATGRHKTALQELKPLAGLEFDGAITLNGQYCYNQKEMIYGNPIRKEDIALLLSYLQAHPLPCGFLEADRVYMNFQNDLVRTVHEAIHSAPFPPGDLSRGLEQDIFQAILYASDQQLAALPPLGQIGLTKWHLGGVDLIPAGGGKAVGIQKVLEYYGIDRSETIAFGDGENDIDMFHAVNISVAMGNAADSVKRESIYVTTDVDDDGIYKALKHFGILE